MGRRMVANRLLEPCAGKLARTVLRGGRRQRCLSLTRQITLGWFSPDFASEIFFDARISKMLSILAAMQSVYFNKRLPKYLPEEYQQKMPTFDCRVWCVPNIVEGANAFLWREQDATKNSISMAARTYFSHKQVENKNGKEMQEMLWQKGVNWNDYPAFFKRGTFIQRRKTMKPFTAEELDRLPPKHKARTEPPDSLFFERTEYVALDMPPFGKVTNRPEVIFYGAEPIVLQEAPLGVETGA